VTRFVVENLNLSKNTLGYSGIEEISKALTNNKSIKVLNVFHNLFDVNGARRLAECLEKNSTIQAIDVGYNRIKDLGIKTILKSVLSNETTSLRVLATRYNFIRDATFKEIMNQLSTNTKSKINHLEISNNSISNIALSQEYQDYLAAGNLFQIDCFDSLHFISPEKLERTVWLSNVPSTTTLRSIYNSIKTQEWSLIESDGCHIGVPLYIGLRRGRKQCCKKTDSTLDIFIEFVLPNSCNRLLKMASTTGFLVNGKKLRIYKAGSKPERLIIKKKNPLGVQRGKGQQGRRKPPQNRMAARGRQAGYRGGLKANRR